MTTKSISIELPDELIAIRGWSEEKIAAKTKEALAMALLREHEISQGKAAELLAIDRHELFATIPSKA